MYNVILYRLKGVLMKRNKLIAVLLVMLIACLCAMVVACNNDEDKEFIPSEITIPAPDDGIPDVEYKVTVLYPDQSPVVGAEVKLFYVKQDSTPFTGATTGSDGIAVLYASQGLEYFIVLANLPEGYAYDDEALIASNETTKTVVIESLAQTDRYVINVVSEGGMPMEGIKVSLKDGDNLLASKVTDQNGSVGIKVNTFSEYDIVIEGLPNGYSLVNENPKTPAAAGKVDIVVKSEVIKEAMPANYRYEMDDIMYDFTVTTSEGKTFTLSEVLKEKKFVLINFWATWCSPCKEEFRGIQYSYDRYEDDMAIIAISTSDTNESVIGFKSSYTPTLTFDMSTDSASLYGRFSAYSSGNIPLSIFVDRYGKICNFISGSGTEALFRQEFARYTAEDYVQVAYDPANDEIPIEEADTPEEEMPASETIVNKISPTLGGTYEAETDGTTWPWYLGKDGNDDILYAGNIKHHSTTSILYYDFKLNPGEFLTFDYYMNTEDVGNADIMSVYIDGSWMCDLDRVSDGWQTKYLYTPLSASVDPEDANRTHTLMFYYTKDASDGASLDGEELVAVKNIRAVAENEIPSNVDVNIVRSASWDRQAVDGVEQYTRFVKVVFNSTDGYYHVGTEDGPYLLANLGGSTHYHANSISAFAASDYFELLGIQTQLGFISDGLKNPPADSYVEYHKGYTWFAKNSTLPNYCYVDARLKTTLDIIVHRFATVPVNGSLLVEYYNENTWLELCSYVENYSGEGIGNIMEGISNKEAIEAVGGNQPNHVVVDRVLVPRGFMYKYTPSETGAYKIYSIIPEEYSSQQGGYVYITGDGWVKSEDAAEDFEQYVSFIKDHTYYIGVAFDLPSSLGELDFYIEYLGESADHFYYVADGTYTYILDDAGNEVLDENGEIIYIINKFNSSFDCELGEDGYYHQILLDGTLDMGENSYIWIALSAQNSLFNATLQELASTVKVDGLEVGFFDFSNEGGEDYSEYIKELCEEANAKNAEDETFGMIKADEKLVEIIIRALDRVGHDSEDSWLGFAFYHEHLGEYPAKAQD